MADIPVVNEETGERGTVPGENLRAALDSGFRVEEVAEQIAREKQEVAELQPVRAGAEALARGSTLGLSDVLAREVAGEDTAARMLARREANPLVAGGLEALGALGTSLATGGLGTTALGTGLAARLGGGAAARLAGTALASGLETAAYSAGAEASQAALENRDLRAEKLLAAMGPGFAMGGLGAGVLGAGGMALSKAATGAGRLAGRAIAAAIPEGAVAKAAAEGGGEAIETAAQKIAGVVPEGTVPTPTVNEVLEGAAQAAEAAAPTQPDGFIASMLETAGKQVPDASTVETEMRRRLSEGAQNQRFAAMGFIKSNLKKALKGFKGEAAEKKLASMDDTIKELDLIGGISTPRQNLKRTLAAKDRLIAESDLLYGNAGSESGKFFDPGSSLKAMNNVLDEVSALKAPEARAARERLQGLAERFQKLKDSGDQISFLDARKIGTELDDLIEGAFGKDNVSAGILRDLRRTYRNNLMDQVEAAAGKGVRDKIKTTNRHLSNLFDIEDAGLDALERSGNRGMSLTDYIAMVGAPDPLSGIAYAGANKLWREYGASISAKVLDAAAKHPFLSTAAEGVAGFGRTLAGQAAREGSAEAVRLAREASKLSRTMNKGVEAIFTGAPHIARKQVGEAMPAMADMLGLALDEEPDEHQKFDVTKKGLAKLANNPEQMMERMQHALEIQSGADAKASPEFAATAANAVRYLQSIAPKAPAPDSIIGAKPWRPSDAQLHEFKNAVNTVMAPLDTLERVRQGVLTNADVHALQGVYPSLYGQLRKQVAEAAARQGNKLSYAQRLAVGRFLQGPLERTTDPAYVAAMQQNYSGGQPQPEQAPPGPASTRRPASAKTPQSARLAVTETQRLEARSAAQ